MRSKLNIRSLVIVTLSLLCAGEECFGGKGLLYKEVNLLGGYSDRDSWVYATPHLKNSIGFEYFKKFSSDYGDFLTADVQVRLTYDFAEKNDDALGLEIHNAWLEYNLGLGGKVRAGHFAPAFGLESIVDTHGTLLQNQAMKNVGLKKDWGVGYRGFRGNFDYEITAQLGYGMALRSYEDSFLLAGRIGSLTDRNFQYGLSLMFGRVIESMEMSTFPPSAHGPSVPKKRLGIDGQYAFRSFTLQGEVAFGEDNSYTVISVFSRGSYTPPSRQNLEIALQYSFWNGDIRTADAQTIRIETAILYKILSSVTVGAAYMYSSTEFDGSGDNRAFLQVYYFGK